MKLLLAVLLSTICAVHSARILAVLPIPSKSHNVLQYSIFRALAERGHQVEVYSALPPPFQTKNVTHSLIQNSFLDLIDNWTFEEFAEFCIEKPYFGFGVSGFWELIPPVMEEVFQDEKIQKLLSSEDKFDLIFTEATLSMESLTVLGHKFKAPIVNFQGFGTWTVVNWVAGNPLSISHLPDPNSFTFTNEMTFMERFRNFISTSRTLLFYHFNMLPMQQKVLDKYYKDPTTPPVVDMLKNIAITLTNDYKTLEYPRPYTPNVIPIGGAHMSTHMTPLPQDVKKFMDEAKNGVIFFSFGTIVPIHLLPNEYTQAFIDAFKKLSARILWKTHFDSLPGLPENVKLTKWVPQPTVLAHPNCVLFMTHGGLFSQHEALYAGVPVVAVPFFADQQYDVRFYEYLGVGVKLDFLTIPNGDSVHKAITTVLNDKRYKKNALKASAIVRDQPMAPLDTAVFWIEYVLRHRGAPHLRPVSAVLPWYQLWLLDIAAALLVFITLAVIVLYKIIKSFLNIFRSKKANVAKDKKRN